MISLYIAFVISRSEKFDLIDRPVFIYKDCTHARISDGVTISNTEGDSDSDKGNSNNNSNKKDISDNSNGNNGDGDDHRNDNLPTKSDAEFKGQAPWLSDLIETIETNDERWKDSAISIGQMMYPSGLAFTEATSAGEPNCITHFKKDTKYERQETLGNLLDGGNAFFVGDSLMRQVRHIEHVGDNSLDTDLLLPPSSLPLSPWYFFAALRTWCPWTV